MQLPGCEFAAVRGPGLSTRQPCRRPFPTRTAASTKNKPSIVKLCVASRRDGAEFGSGQQVDEGMAVLRRRIDEIRAAEHGSEQPAEWAVREEDEWYAAADDANVCCDLLISALQALLLTERPGVGVGIVAALALAVPASALVLVSHLLLSNLPH